MEKKIKLSKTKKVITGILVSCFFCLGLSNYVRSNNVQVTNVSMSDSTITFNIQWDNSWRNTSTANSTMNYDGVWVFVKYRDACDRTSAFPSSYSHVWLKNDTVRHTTNGSVLKQMGTTIIPYVTGTSRAMGVFLYRKYDGSGTFPTTGKTSVTLIWDQTAQGTVGGDWDIRVFATEMVYIPRGPFRIGSGNVTYNAIATANFSSKVTGLIPYTVTAENTTIIVNPTPAGSQGNPGDLFTQPAYSTNSTIPENFPKGYDPFWVMKYEVTQGQYCDFLNSLDRQEQLYAIYQGGPSAQYTLATTASIDAYRWVMYTTSMLTPFTPVNRQYIRTTPTFIANKPITFGCDANNNGVLDEANDGQWTACNFLYFNNVSSYTALYLRKYLNWAGLRPMSEFEYEKICRGQTSQVALMSNELVWGTDGSAGGRNPWNGTISFANTINETPMPTPGSVQGEYICCNTSLGPLRVGSTLTSSVLCTRTTTGSSFYGVTDMAGNVWEYVWSFGLNGANTSIYPAYPVNTTNPWLTRASNGNGVTTTYSNWYTPTSMPAAWGQNQSATYGGYNQNIIYEGYWRGGAWDNLDAQWQAFTISYRGVVNGAGYTVTDANAGGRGVRTAE
ncbi:MAG: formylglycine-generating enzyme family protein [Bacteroidetes bacterium]|nr:formylglycine-generating enzyme family protein [Bacteroidota bacterium]